MFIARMTFRFNRLAVATLLSACVATPVWAQSADGKAKLIDKLLTLWHPEDVVVMMVQRPAADAVQQARIALQGRVTAERRDATLKDMAVDVQKYINEATPIALDTARRQLASSVVPILQQQFSEEELKQIIAMLESPVKKKFEQMIPQMERALGEKVVAESRAAIDPKMQALTQAVGLKLRAATTTP
ncbi:MAG TPA: DUF2059 domain-containing protein [Aquabacterium sp.]|uniref:DUF2059 domain-containing protein n=1 Tax=Aquabacterium sp. TaxID=1872578 RepID=UPI002E33CC81|nr:DUF2059 domain-containing protein [Aquabacterium sp.]HEX5355229.1 DUF2059 domain-containing protein [Aquabacterium sp.]